MEISIRKKLGKKLKELRKGKEYTQEKLSQLAGIDYKYLQRIKGKAPPNLKIETIDKFAKALKVDPAELL